MSAANKKSSTPDSNDVEMPLIAHLKELRDRLLKCIYAVAAVLLCLIYFAKDIYAIAAQPMRAVLPEGANMIAVDIATPFLAPFKLTLWVSFMVAMPYILYQIWSFIAPALYRNEKRVAIPLFISSVMLFYSGLAFAYFLVLKVVFGFFVGFFSEEWFQVAPDINAYLSFALKIFFAFGVAFEIPVATVLLVWAGIISPQSLSQKRPYVIVGCFVVAMFLTPPDIFTQSMLAVPMWLLFELGIVFGRWVSTAKSDESTNGEQSTSNT